MKAFRRLITPALALLASFAGVRCSSNQNTVTADVFHNTTAHFNGYYYAREKAREVEKAILKSLDDDPNQVLTLFPHLDTTLAKSYKKDTEEIVKMASISIQRHPNSRWVDDNYLMVGLARMYDCDFSNAVQTFKYVNTKSTDTELRHRALIHLLRVFTEQKEYDKAEETFLFLEKEKLSKANAKGLYLEKAFHYQVRADYDNMVRNLTLADSLLSPADRKGRIYFIIGQVYQKLGFSSEAYNYYRKCLSTNPDYEIDFYARLNMAQVARLDNNKNVKLIRKQFEKLLADTKNAEFKDKIYFELGEFERKQGNVSEAIQQYKLSAHAGKNKRIQGSAYLRIGELYFDSLKRFSLAKAYYDSAMASLPKEFENYDAIKKRHAVLGDFAKYTETIQWQDSLLFMATLDSAQLRKRIDSVFASGEKKDNGKKKKRRKTVDSGGDTRNSSFFQQESTSTTDWYFGNPSAVSSGQGEFLRIWGNIPLEDNWRRSTRTAELTATAAAIVDQTAVSTQPVEAAKPAANPAEEAYLNLSSELPRSEKARSASLAMIEEAYFKLGDLYYFQLGEKDNAENSYRKLLDRFPESLFTAEVLYKLYLIHKEKGDSEAETIASTLKEKYPNSTFTRILLNPDYLKETSVAQEKQKIIYKEAYADFQRNNLRGAQEKIKAAKALGETSFVAQLDLLQILITGKTEDVNQYQYELGEFMKKYPDGSSHAYAEQLLASAKGFVEKTERSKGIRFSPQLEGQYYFVIVHRIQDKASQEIDQRMNKFNATIPGARKMELTNLIFNENWALTFIGNFSGMTDAMTYYHQFNDQVGRGEPFSRLNFHNFVITTDNFNIFYRYKALDEYLSFFDRHYEKNP